MYHLNFRRYINRGTLSSVYKISWMDCRKCNTVPKKTRVVICGGGVMGAAVAYHLAELGWGDSCVLLEKGRCGGGTTWHLSGLVGVFKPTHTQVKLAKSSIQLYKNMEERGLKTGWKQCGSLCVARTRDRMTVYRRMKAQSVCVGDTAYQQSMEKAHCPSRRVHESAFHNSSSLSLEPVNGHVRQYTRLEFQCHE